MAEELKTVRLEMDLTALEGLDDALRAVLGDVVQQAARDIEAHAKALMEAPKTGRIYEQGEQEIDFTTAAGVSVKFRARKGKAARQHQASAPGEAPARDEGNLFNSVQARMTGQLTVEVDVAADYAYVLEFGGENVAPRPFLTPAAEAVGPGFIAAVTSVTKRKLEG